jgi:hypothetical protein
MRSTRTVIQRASPDLAPHQRRGGEYSPRRRLKSSGTTDRKHAQWCVCGSPFGDDVMSTDKNPCTGVQGQDEVNAYNGRINAAHATVKPDPQADLFGDAAQPQPPALIVNSQELGRICRHCKGETWLTTPPKGPHAMGLVCISCGVHGGWVPSDVAAELRRKGGLSS